MNQIRISAALRRQVRERARERCEYCLLAETQAFFPHEPDHIIALKHGGRPVADNLALACLDCNRFKGSDIASVDPVSGELTPLFNPRTQRWDEHFHLTDGHIVPLTALGRATARLAVQSSSTSRCASHARVLKPNLLAVIPLFTKICLFPTCIFFPED